MIKKIYFLLSIFSATTLVAFAQQTVKVEEGYDISFTQKQEDWMMDKLTNEYNLSCNNRDACGQSLDQAFKKDGYDVWSERIHDLMEEGGSLFKGVEKKYEALSKAVDDIDMTLIGEKAIEEAEKMSDLLEKSVPELSAEIKEDVQYAQVTSEVGQEGILLNIDGENIQVTPGNFGEIVGQYGMSVFDDVQKQMAEIAEKEYGMSKEDFRSNWNHAKQSFIDVASDKLERVGPDLLGPPTYTNDKIIAVPGEEFSPNYPMVDDGGLWEKFMSDNDEGDMGDMGGMYNYDHGMNPQDALNAFEESGGVVTDEMRQQMELMNADHSSWGAGDWAMTPDQQKMYDSYNSGGYDMGSMPTTEYNMTPQQMYDAYKADGGTMPMPSGGSYPQGGALLYILLDLLK